MVETFLPSLGLIHHCFSINCGVLPVTRRIKRFFSLSDTLDRVFNTARGR